MQQLAVSYIRNGYFFYVTGQIPERKDPASVDRKFIERYDLSVSKWTRARRKRAGFSNIQYLRFERFFVLLATKGEHPFFAEEANLIRDVRRVPIKFAGYSIGFRKGTCHVGIERKQYTLLKSYLLDLAVRRSAENLERVFATLPFEPYGGVLKQLHRIRRQVNKARDVAGFERVRWESLRRWRNPVKPFEEEEPERRRKAFGQSQKPPS